jgi:putative tryptophan/tyrosine transport system substrate-binding protein
LVVAVMLGMRGGRRILVAGSSLTRDRRLPYRPGMDRRRFLLTSLAGALVAPFLAGAQQPRKLGYLSNSSSESAADSAFMQALRDLGWVDGQTIVIEARYTAGAMEQTHELARDLVGRGVAVIAV